MQEILGQSGVNINEPETGGCVPLIVACKKGRVDIVRWLLSHPRIQVDKSDNESDKALQAAVAIQSIELVRLLLDHGANVNGTDGDGCTPLGVMTEQPQSFNVHILNTLLDRGADVRLATYAKTGLTILHLVCAELDDGDLADRLISRGCNVNAQTFKRPHCNFLTSLVIEYSRVTPVHAASDSGHWACLTTLLRHNADPDRTDELGRSALQLASCKGHISCVDELINYGCKVDGQSSGNGPTALYLSSEEDHLQCVESLLNAGANTDTLCEGSSEFRNKSKEGLMQAFGNLYSSIVGNVIPEKGRATALYRASKNGHTLCVEKLLSSGADHRLQNANGHTPLAIACMKDHTGCLAALMEAGASLVPCDGMTALHIACQNGSLSCVELLLPTSDINAVSRDRKQAIHYAAENGHAACVKLLLPRQLVVDENCVMSPLELAQLNRHGGVVNLLRGIPLPSSFGGSSKVGKAEGGQRAVEYRFSPTDGAAVTSTGSGVRCGVHVRARHVVQTLQLPGR